MRVLKKNVYLNETVKINLHLNHYDQTDMDKKKTLLLSGFMIHAVFDALRQGPGRNVLH